MQKERKTSDLERKQHEEIAAKTLSLTFCFTQSLQPQFAIGRVRAGCEVRLESTNENSSRKNRRELMKG